MSTDDRILLTFGMGAAAAVIPTCCCALLAFSVDEPVVKGGAIGLALGLILMCVAAWVTWSETKPPTSRPR